MESNDLLKSLKEGNKLESSMINIIDEQISYIESQVNKDTIEYNKKQIIDAYEKIRQTVEEEAHAALD